MFTPLEYSCVGLSEEEAEKRHGKDGIEVRFLAISSSWQQVKYFLNGFGVFSYIHISLIYFS